MSASTCSNSAKLCNFLFFSFFFFKRVAISHHVLWGFIYFGIFPASSQIATVKLLFQTAVAKQTIYILPLTIKSQILS